MADLTSVNIRAAFPEFADTNTYPAALINAAIATAYALTDVSAEATKHCVAHLLALHQQQVAEADGGAGEITAERTGPTMRQFMTQAESGREVFFTSTAYGRSCLALEKRTPKSVFSPFFA